MIDEVKEYLKSFNGEITEDNGLFIFKYIAGERETALNKTKVSYTAKFRILDDKKLVRFSEVISEISSGLGVSSEMSPGIGFKKETYKTTDKGREGKLTEKSTLGGKKLEYAIDYRAVRNTIKEIAERNGYTFKYKILPWGI